MFNTGSITKDGVTVAKEIELENKFENMGAQMVREVASKTSDQAGDGTTTATVLAHAIVREGGKAVTAGMNPNAVSTWRSRRSSRTFKRTLRMSPRTRRLPRSAPSRPTAMQRSGAFLPML